MALQTLCDRKCRKLFEVITLSMKNASLEKVFKSIKRQSGFSFVFNDDVKAKEVSIDIEVMLQTNISPWRNVLRTFRRLTQ
jgi:hypothetical protein